MKDVSDLGYTSELAFQHLQYHFWREVQNRGMSFVKEPSQTKSLKEVSDWLVSSKQHRWLAINGITGNGKTTCIKAMRSFINSCKIPAPISSEDSCFSSKAGIWIVSARELYDLFGKNRGMFDRCMNTYILAIDELGTEEVNFCEYGNRYKPVEQLLSYRYDQLLPTIITTNLPISGVRPKYGDRIAERLNEIMDVIHFPDINFRIKR